MLSMKRKKPSSCHPTTWLLISVGATGFEPATAWSQTRSATGLRYTPLFPIASAKVTSFSDPCKFSCMFFLKFSFTILTTESHEKKGDLLPLPQTPPIIIKGKEPCGTRDEQSAHSIPATSRQDSVYHYHERDHYLITKPETAKSLTKSARLTDKVGDFVGQSRRLCHVRRYPLHHRRSKFRHHILFSHKLYVTLQDI